MPERTCVCCRKKSAKDRLLRVVVPEDAPIFDKVQRMPGRGFYLCPDDKCIEKFVDEKKINKILKRKITVLSALRELLKTEVEASCTQNKKG
ncbi:MAG: YlxR family protein [Candidatus Magnetominusculus sp. LBB02]|nr:YlxR family protein [Candidatus Magnetominusculus sp. LBB02]